MMCDAENDTPMLTVYTCATCRYVSVTPGRCRSHPYPMRGMGPPMVPVEVVPASALDDLRDENERLREAADLALCWIEGVESWTGPGVADEILDVEKALTAALAVPAPKEDDRG